jgi:phospholipid transport system transporter-binding protein
MTFAEASELTAAVPECFDCKAVMIDLGEVERVDSSALGVLLEWLRQAAKRNCRLHFLNPPRSLRTLADLYGVTELIDSL